MHSFRSRFVLRFVLSVPFLAGLGLIGTAQVSPPRSAQLEDSFDAPVNKEVVDNARGSDCGAEVRMKSSPLLDGIEVCP
jgi:hypothetical protein